MGGVSTFVIAKNRKLLGQSVPESKRAVVALLLRDEAVSIAPPGTLLALRPEPQPTCPSPHAPALTPG